MFMHIILDVLPQPLKVIDCLAVVILGGCHGQQRLLDGLDPGVVVTNRSLSIGVDKVRFDPLASVAGLRVEDIYTCTKNPQVLILGADEGRGTVHQGYWV